VQTTYEELLGNDTAAARDHDTVQQPDLAGDVNFALAPALVSDGSEATTKAGPSHASAEAMAASAPLPVEVSKVEFEPASPSEPTHTPDATSVAGKNGKAARLARARQLMKEGKFAEADALLEDLEGEAKTGRRGASKDRSYRPLDRNFRSTTFGKHGNRSLGTQLLRALRIDKGKVPPVQAFVERFGRTVKLGAPELNKLAVEAYAMCNERFEHIRRDQVPWLNELLIRAAEAGNVPEAEIAKQLFDQRIVDDDCEAASESDDADAEAGNATRSGDDGERDQHDVFTNGSNSNGETE
jgi:hypothetical protein